MTDTMSAAQHHVLSQLMESHDELIANGYHWDEEQGDYVRPGNLLFDHGTGYSMLMDDLEAAFGGTVDFGYAGGCVNMALFIEHGAGYRVIVTDAYQPFLTPLHGHTPDTGYTVGVYTRDGFIDGGEAVALVNAHVGSDQLHKVITAALKAAANGTCGNYYPKWSRSCGLPAGHTEERHRECEVSWTDEMAKEPRR